MNSELIAKFWELWRARKRSEISYEDSSLGVKFLSYKRVHKLCDRISNEKWQKISVVSQSGVHSILWHQDDDRIFIRQRGRTYGPPLSKYYGVSVIEFTLDIVKKTIVLGIVPD